MTSLVDVNTYQFLQNICPFSAARHPLSATRPTAWWMELMDMAACPTPARLDWHIKEREGGGETKRQRESLDGCLALPCQQASEGQKHGGSSVSTQMSTTTEKILLTWRLNMRIVRNNTGNELRSTSLLLLTWFLWLLTSSLVNWNEMNDVLLSVH